MGNIESKIKEIIKEIKAWEGSKGIRNRKPQIKQLRKELYDMFPKDKMWLVVGDYVLEKSYNPKLDKEFITIFSKEGWDKKENYRINKWS